MSLSWCAVYLQGEVPADFTSPVEGRLEVRTLGPWTELGLGGLGEPAPIARHLSERVAGEVISIAVQSTATALSVVHCVAGAEVRRLDFADGTWLSVEGTPRPWERALYRAERLEDELLDTHDEGEAELRAAYARAAVQTGDSLPWPDLLDSILHALGVTEAQWNQTRAAPPRQVLERFVTSGSTHALRAGAGLTVALVLGALFTARDVRGVFAMFAVMTGLFTGFGALLRRGRVGRWLF